HPEAPADRADGGPLAPEPPAPAASPRTAPPSAPPPGAARRAPDRERDALRQAPQHGELARPARPLVSTLAGDQAPHSRGSTRRSAQRRGSAGPALLIHTVIPPLK